MRSQVKKFFRIRRVGAMKFFYAFLAWGQVSPLWAEFYNMFENN